MSGPDVRCCIFPSSVAVPLVRCRYANTVKPRGSSTLWCVPLGALLGLKTRYSGPGKMLAQRHLLWMQLDSAPAVHGDPTVPQRAARRQPQRTRVPRPGPTRPPVRTDQLPAATVCASATKPRIPSAVLQIPRASLLTVAACRARPGVNLILGWQAAPRAWLQ